MTENPQQCGLCGQDVHERPVPAPFGLTCPTPAAPEEMQEQYRQRVADAHQAQALLSGHPAAQHLVNHPEVVGQLLARKDRWDERLDKEHPTERALVSHEQLVEDIDRRIPAVAAKVEVNALFGTEDFEPPDNFRVASKPPSPELIRNPGARVKEAADWELYLGSEGVGR